jgi:DNA-binding NtrC family response regulator
MAKILIVDDDLGIRELLQEILQDHGHVVLQAGDAKAATKALRSGKPDLIFLDIWMPDMDGLDLLRLWRRDGGCDAVVIVMSGQATLDTAVEATRQGALDFLEKPISLQKFLAAVAQGLAHGRSLMEEFAAVQANLLPPKSTKQAARMPSGAAPVVDKPALQTQNNAAAALRLDLPLREARELFELSYFRFHLDAAEGNVAKVAKRTGLERTHLYRKLHSLNLLRADVQE